MKIVNFDSAGESLKLSFIFNGLIDASYTYTLWDGSNNNVIERKKGNNKNPEDDVYNLPEPIKDNNERIIQFSTSFIGTDPKNFKDYSIKAEIYQGDKLIGNDEDKGTVNGKAQDSLMFFKLKS